MTNLSFAVVDARPEPYAAAPTLVLRLRIEEGTAARVQTIALRCQVQIEPRRRHYSSTEEARLLELFGEPQRWGDTLRSVLWANTSVTVPAFRESVEVDLPIACTYDFEVASAKYFHSLDDGEIPLLLLFSGSVFVDGPTGLAIDQVPWHHEASFRLPVETWRRMMDMYFPDSAWIRLRRETFDALHRFRGEHALTSWEEAVETLLEEAGRKTPADVSTRRLA
jgi:hypothetical protein